jgi:hypothetical protein
VTDVQTIRVFSRPGCHLCELLLEELVPLVRGRAHVDVIDIDPDAELRETYRTRIPVVEIDGQVLCQYHLDRAAIEAALRGGTAAGPADRPS